VGGGVGVHGGGQEGAGTARGKAGNEGLRNEANLEGRGCRSNGLGGGGRAGGGGAAGLQEAQVAEGALVGALSGVDAALQAREHLGADVEDVAEGRLLIETEGGFEAVFPDMGVGASEAAELPVVADESIDVEALFGGGGLEARGVFGGPGIELRKSRSGTPTRS
jgi:hypothetical protein